MKKDEIKLDNLNRCCKNSENLNLEAGLENGFLIFHDYEVSLLLAVVAQWSESGLMIWRFWVWSPVPWVLSFFLSLVLFFLCLSLCQLCVLKRVPCEGAILLNFQRKKKTRLLTFWDVAGERTKTYLGAQFVRLLHLCETISTTSSRNMLPS